MYGIKNLWQLSQLHLRREPLTMGKQLVNFITCGCESNAPFLQFTKPGANPAVLVIGLYELLGNPTT
jgi:hypothetical protein